jgi:hypothetical protein
MLQGFSHKVVRDTVANATVHLSDSLLCDLAGNAWATPIMNAFTIAIMLHASDNQISLCRTYFNGRTEPCAENASAAEEPIVDVSFDPCDLIA